MLCVSLFIIKYFQSLQKKINFLNERKFGSLLYFVLCSLKFRLLSCEFSIVPGRGLCESLLTKRFTTTRNLSCERKHMFLGIFTSMPFISVCHTVQWNYRSWNSFGISTMAHRRNLRNENTESELNCEIGSDDYVEDRIRCGWRLLWWGRTTITTSAMKTLESGDCSVRLTRHMSISLWVVTEERSRIKHHT